MILYKSKRLIPMDPLIYKIRLITHYDNHNILVEFLQFLYIVTERIKRKSAADWVDKDNTTNITHEQRRYFKFCAIFARNIPQVYLQSLFFIVNFNWDSSCMVLDGCTYGRLHDLPLTLDKNPCYARLASHYRTH